MATNADDVLTNVLIRACKILREGVSIDDFTDYQYHVTEELPKMELARQALVVASDRDCSDEIIQGLTDELFHSALKVAMGSMLMLGSFPLFSMVEDTMVNEVTSNA
jgi:hypothetical protein